MSEDTSRFGTAMSLAASHGTLPPLELDEDWRDFVETVRLTREQSMVPMRSFWRAILSIRAKNLKRDGRRSMEERGERAELHLFKSPPSGRWFDVTMAYIVKSREDQE